MLGQIATTCAGAGCPVSVCGEIAGQSLEAAVLIALGFEALSVPPAALGPVKRMVLALDRGKLAEKLVQWMDQPGQPMRENLLAWASRTRLPL